MPLQSITPAQLTFVDGVPYASTFDDVYHSADGGIGQARHVFLGGNRLPQRWHERERFTILETGFGFGLSFLTTWQTWRDDPLRARTLHYVAIEKHPFSAADLAQLHARWPELGELSSALLAAWPTLTPGYHRLLLEEGRVVLTLIFGDIADCLPQMVLAADAFYLDGFAPDKNPAMWAPELLARLHRFAALDATLATYTVAASVRHALSQAGFVCEKLPGFARKRHMLAGRFQPRWSVDIPQAPRRDAIVIGAGIAGSAACERLAARGWQVTLIERHAQPAQETSGNRAGIVMPLPSRDDNLASRLTRACYLFAARHWQHLGGIGKAFAGNACGVLQLAQDTQQAAMQRDLVAEYSRDFVDRLSAEQIAARFELTAPHGGWLFPQGGWVAPSSWCKALLAACGPRLQRRFCREALQLQHVQGVWVASDAGGVIAQAPIVIVASGAQAASLPHTAGLPLTLMRGQVTEVPASVLPAIALVICGDGYLTPPSDGVCSLGASYDDDSDPQLRAASQQDNLSRLAALLPQADNLADLPLAGKVGFRCIAQDRLPLAGALPDMHKPITGSRLRDVPRLPGMHALLAYGSRGLTFAPLLAELLAAQLEGEPWPIERELAEALDPARFALKAHRRQTG